MNFDERASNARTDLGTLLDAVDTPPASHIRTVSRRRRALQAGAGALAAAVAALGVVAVVERNDHKEPLILTPPSTAAPTNALTSHLVLPVTTVVSGETLTGTLVVENPDANAVTLETCPSPLTAVLVNASNESETFANDCEVEQVVIGPHSESTWNVEVPAAFEGQPLPPGVYRTELLSSDLPRPTPIDVTVTATAVETTTTTTTASAPTFPAAVEPTHGGTTWAVVIAGAFVEPGTPLDRNETLNSAVAVAARGGYTTGPTDCDQGADVAWGASPDATDFYSVSVYFGSEADARQANEALEAIGWNSGVVAQVETFCLD